MSFRAKLALICGSGNLRKMSRFLRLNQLQKTKRCRKSERVWREVAWPPRRPNGIIIGP